VWPERIALENETHLALFRGYEDAVGDGVDHPVSDPDFAAGQVFEAGDHAQRRGLAAAGRTKQAHEFAIEDFKVEIGDRIGGVYPVVFLRAAQVDGRHQLPSPSARFVRVSFWATSVPK
jgi:hypothetical protein